MNARTYLREYTNFSVGIQMYKIAKEKSESFIDYSEMGDYVVTSVDEIDSEKWQTKFTLEDISKYLIVQAKFSLFEHGNAKPIPPEYGLSPDWITYPIEFVNNSYGYQELKFNLSDYVLQGHTSSFEPSPIITNHLRILQNSTKLKIDAINHIINDEMFRRKVDFNEAELLNHMF